MDFINSDETTRECPNCKKTYCINCCKEIYDIHFDKDCITTLYNRTTKNNRQWLSKNTQTCPKCNSVYEKSDGCNHMICSKCRPVVHFCYICGAKLKQEK